MNVSIPFRPKLADIAHPGTAPADADGAPASGTARKEILQQHAVPEAGAPKEIPRERAVLEAGAPGAAVSAHAVLEAGAPTVR